MRTIVAVPARLASSRLPGKILADIAGKPMLQCVLEACRQVRSSEAVVLCTDAPHLTEAARRWGCQALLTSPACSSAGSDRLRGRCAGGPCRCPC
jgi:3-deoxy-manno-octulosonate cytidylyltransferase (CMP-KDO synthetase)